MKNNENIEYTEETENIEDQFNLSKMELSPEFYFSEDTLNVFRMFFIFSIFWIGGFLFYTYFDIEFISLEKYWKNYTETCCYNLTKCNFSDTCEEIFYRWINLSVSDKTVINRCCYWFAPYNETIKAFCNSSCFLS